MIGERGKTLMLCVSGAIAISPPATPASAVMSGSSVASSEPNTMNSTIAAASKPTSVPRDSGGSFFDGLAAQLDVESRFAGRLRRGDHPGGVRRGQVAGLLGEVDDGVGGAVV